MNDAVRRRLARPLFGRGSRAAANGKSARARSLNSRPGQALNIQEGLHLWQAMDHLNSFASPLS